MKLILNEFKDEKLLPVILKLTEHQSVKIKTDCIEILIKIIPENKTFFNQQKSKLVIIGFSNFIFKFRFERICSYIL